MARTLKALTPGELGRAIRYAQKMYEEGHTGLDAVKAIMRRYKLTLDSASRLQGVAIRQLYKA